MKKLIAILMCVSLVFSLAACTGKDEGDVTPPTGSHDNKEPAGENNKVEATDDEAGKNDDKVDENDVAGVPGATAAPDTTAPATTEANKPAANKISRGKISGDVYSNGYMGLSFTKPADWVYLTDEEISQTINIGQSVMDLDDIEMAIAKTATIFDMATKDAYGNSVMICYENTILTASREVTLDEYEKIMITNMENVDAIDYEHESSEDVKLGNTTFRKIVFSANVQNTELTQAYYARVIGKYVVSVILTSSTVDIETMEGYFGK